MFVLCLKLCHYFPVLLIHQLCGLARVIQSCWWSTSWGMCNVWLFSRTLHSVRHHHGGQANHERSLGDCNTVSKRYTQFVCMEIACRTWGVGNKVPWVPTNESSLNCTRIVYPAERWMLDQCWSINIHSTDMWNELLSRSEKRSRQRRIHILGGKETSICYLTSHKDCFMNIYKLVKHLTWWNGWEREL